MKVFPLALAGACCFTGCGGGGSSPAPEPTGRAKWTILVYMNAANDLSAFDAVNVNQMETVAGNPDVRFVLQWKQARGSWDGSPEFQGTRRYLVRRDASSALASTLVEDLGPSVDMGKAQTLRDFVTWGRARYPSDRVGVVVWNHGNGWRRGPAITRGVSYDDQTGSHIDTWQLKEALGTGLDFVAWDSSLMQMTEVAHELRGVTPFVVGSEESPPGSGYPYQRVFAPFRDRPDAPTRDILKGFVDGMLAEPTYAKRKITQSVVATDALTELRRALDGLAVALPRLPTATVTTVRARAQNYSDTSDRTFRDLGSLLTEIDALTADVVVRDAVARVRVALATSVVWEGHNAQSSRSTGLAIDFSSATSFNGSSKKADYARMTFGSDGLWDEWLTIAP